MIERGTGAIDLLRQDFACWLIMFHGLLAGSIDRFAFLFHRVVLDLVVIIIVTVAVVVHGT